MDCHRVVVSVEGEACPEAGARDLGFVPVVVFIRSDGWTLGAPARFVDVAYGMWADEWVSFQVGEQIHPISEWRSLRESVVVSPDS